MTVTQLLMPVVVAAGAGLVIHKFSWREYPALIAWMSLAVFVQGLTYGRPYPAWMAPIACAFLGCAVCEVRWCSRFLTTKAQRNFFCAMAVLLALAPAVGTHGLTWTQRAFLFRSYFFLEAFGVLAVLVVYRLVRPVLECQRHQVYRIGMMLWIGVSAVTGAFVNGGIGYRLLPYTRARYQLIGTVAYWAMMATVGGMAIAMWVSAPGRKRAAKTPKGLTRTGLIESGRAA
jgi:hypothetical protein